MSDDDDDGEKGWLEIYTADRYSSCCYIAWTFENDGEGGSVGENEYTEKHLAESIEPNNREVILAEVTAAKTDGVKRGAYKRFEWPSSKKANAALKAINYALKHDKGGAWPEWAVKAKAAGWKPPKGWKP